MKVRYLQTSTLHRNLKPILRLAATLMAAAALPVQAGGTFNITTYGAIGDGVTDCASAIKAAVDAASASGGGTVLIPAGTFLLATPCGAVKAFIIPKSNVDIVGLGDESILKVADNMNANAPSGWNVISVLQTTDVVNNVVYRDFKVDCNGANNLEAIPATHKNSAVRLTAGENITIQNLTIVNNAGRQCISLGANQATPQLTDVVIEKCRFLTVGRSLPGNVNQNDHSAIYLQADICRVSDNVFINPTQDNGSTALEIHASNATVERNVVRNFSTGINIVATVMNSEDCLYTHNTVTGVNRAVVYWVGSGKVMDNIQVKHNMFSGLGTYTLIDLDTNVQSPIVSTVIEANSFHCESETVSANRGSGIRIGRCSDLVISDNSFQDLRGRAIEVGLYLQDNEILIEGNLIVDCCQTSDTSYQRAIELNHYGKIDSLTIQNNLIRNSSTTWMKGGIRGNADLGTAAISENQMKNLPDYEIKWDNARGSTAVDIDSLSVKHYGYRSPLNFVRASEGSFWINLTDGLVWKKTSGGDATTGWQTNNATIY